MGVLHGNPFLLASGTATEPAVPLQRSVRLRSSNTAYFNRTFSSSGTDLKRWTLSFWMKRGAQGVQSVPFSSQNTPGTGAASLYFLFTSSNTFSVFYPNTATTLGVATSAVYRDSSAWYHFVVTYDSTQATNTDRIKIYVNGIQQVLAAGGTYPSLNATTTWNSNCPHFISKNPVSAVDYFDGYFTEINSIDGQALTPSSFGGYNAGTNVWEVRKYTGTYGTNGFYLPFTDPASIGADGSGNGNNWTPNGIQISNSALTTYDSMLDVPTNTGSNNANFATLNPLARLFGSPTSTDGNLRTTAVNAVNSATILFPSSGKWYLEGTVSGLSNAVAIGICNTSPSRTIEISYQNNGNKNSGGTITAYGSTYTTNDVIGVAVDCDLQTVTFYKNNVSQGALAFSLSGLSVNDIVAEFYMQAGSDAWIANFGQRPFAGTPPSGFKSLNTYNLPEPTIPRGDKYFEQYLYTGNGGGQQVGEIQKPASLFNLDRSLRLRGSNSASLSRTFVAANRSMWTWSGWVKRGALGGGNIFGAGTSTNYCIVSFNSSDQLRIADVQSSAVQFDGVTTAVFKDPALWYHIVVVMDTAQGTAANRLKVWVNNVLYSLSQYPGSGATPVINAAATNYIGNFSPVINGIDGYIADAYFVNAQALSPTDFGAFDGNNYWTPKAYTGTYGTNGFHLEFEDFSNNTATTIGKDTSGQGNNWTPTGISVTADVTNDSMKDVPTLTSADVANFPTLNFLIKGTPSGGTATMSEGNLAWGTNTNSASTIATIPIPTSGKWYWEAVVTTQTYNFCMPGIIKDPQALANLNAAVGALSTGYAIYSPSGQKYNNAVNAAYMAAVAQNTVITIAFDADTGSLYFGAGGSWANGAGLTNQTWANAVAAYTGLTTGTYYPAISADTTTTRINFGQRPFSHTPPTGYKALNSFNIAEVTGDVETPDFVWIKSRSAGTDHALFNSVAGTGKYLRSSSAGLEVTDVNSLIQFNKNGFLLGNAAIVNASAATFVASAWKAGNTTVTNTNGKQTVTITIASPAVVTATGHSFQNGDIIQLYTTGALPSGLSTGIDYYVVNRATNTFQLSLTSGGSAINTSGTQSGTHSCTFYSQVRANQEAGFSVVTYTGTGANATVGHGLGIAPVMILNKARSSAFNWHVYFGTLGNGDFEGLNTTNAYNSGSNWFNLTAPTSSVFSVGASQGTATYVSYCFSQIAGYSKFGSYTANNDPNGPFVYTGFRPRWLIVKRATTGTTGGWFMYDTARNTYNVMDKYLFAEGAAGDGTLGVFDFTSNGFKIRSNNVHVNSTAGNTYIYMAFAENPFKYALAR